MTGRTIRIALGVVVCALLLGSAPLAHGQGAGPLWVRFFDDQNSNGVLDEGEPVLTGGVAITLLNSAGVTIGAALLEDAPTAAQGVIGFQDLQPGEYTIELTSALYRPTTESRFTRQVELGAPPIILEYGARPIPAQTSRQRGLFGLPIYLGEPEQVARVALAAAISFLVAALMSALGLLIFVVILRRRYRADLRRLQAPATVGGTSTGQGLPPVRAEPR